MVATASTIEANTNSRIFMLHILSFCHAGGPESSLSTQRELNSTLGLLPLSRWSSVHFAQVLLPQPFLSLAHPYRQHGTIAAPGERTGCEGSPGPLAHSSASWKRRAPMRSPRAASAASLQRRQVHSEPDGVSRDQVQSERPVEQGSIWTRHGIAGGAQDCIGPGGAGGVDQE